MAKKKKPVSNPARGFATISIASKSKPEKLVLDVPNCNESNFDQDPKLKTNLDTQSSSREDKLTAEEFEKNLDESALQLLVEQFAQKSKRDVLRQRSKLETEQRVFRGQAEVLDTQNWLSSELVEEILALVKAERRSTGLRENIARISEDVLIIHLWTLQQVLLDFGFPEKKILDSLLYISTSSGNIRPGSKDMIWGLEESLDWLCLECTIEELPDYENYKKKLGRLPKDCLEKVLDSAPESGASITFSKSDDRHVKTTGAEINSTAKSEPQPPLKNVTHIDYESDIDPDDLLSVYLDCKTRLFNSDELESSKGSGVGKISDQFSDSDMRKLESEESSQILRKLKKIEEDVLFDKYIADQQWKTRRIQLMKDSAARLKMLKASQSTKICLPNSEQSSIKIGASIFDGDVSNYNDAILDDLFSSPASAIDLPVRTKVSEVNESKIDVLIRDFSEESSGNNPSKILEELCRTRDSSVKLNYKLVSESSFSNRHSLQIQWSKNQKITCHPPATVNFTSSPNSQIFTMNTIATPNPTQSQAYIATIALYCLFNISNENLLLHRLASSWKNLCIEFSDLEKERLDEEDRSKIRVIRDMVREIKDQEPGDKIKVENTSEKRNISRPTKNEPCAPDRTNSLALDSETIRKIWLEKSNTPNYQNMLKSRKQLPMWDFKAKVLQTIQSSQVVIICGETGCGKSTQVPSFILENQLSNGNPCKIFVTEPRRLSAISLARRVSEELGESKNDLGTSRSLIGYSIRLDSKVSKETSLIFATTGIVMRMLESSNDLKDITHIILDEVHERTIDSDFLLIVIRKILPKRPDLKVLLMSATVDAERFSKYFNEAPVLNVPGRVFPVQVKYLEDAIELTGYSPDIRYQEKLKEIDDDSNRFDSNLDDKFDKEISKNLKGYSNNTRKTVALFDEYQIDFELLTQLLSIIATDSHLKDFSKAILVFLPGIGEIRQLNDMILGHPTFSSNWNIHILHSAIANEDQQAAFSVPLLGIRKIVLATNIAETGITIPDVTCVIDTGKHREMRFDERKQLSRLLETFISKANAKQRRGRAGRVQNGLCFHMFTKYRHDNLMADQQTPELLRLSLQDLAIRVKICKLGGIEETLSQALDPPLPKNIRRAIDALVDVRALTPGEDLTPLGIQLASLPLDVFLGKLILLGCIFKCLDASITIAAILSSKSPFLTPFGSRKQADISRFTFRRGDSDLLTAYNAYLAWKRACISGIPKYEFCKKKFLSQQNLMNIEDLKTQLIFCLVDSGFLPSMEEQRMGLNRNRYTTLYQKFFDLPQASNLNNENDVILQSVIAWSFYPKLLVRHGEGYRNCANNQSISLHPSSVNKGQRLKWLSYYQIMKANQFYNAHETTAVDEFAIALLCGDARCDMYAGVITLDGNKARFSVSDWKTMLVFKILREKLREVLAVSFKKPGNKLNKSHQRWMEMWQKVFSQKSIGEK